MLRETKRISGLSDDILLPQIRAVHQHYKTSEYSRLLEELPCLKEQYRGQDIREVFDEAIHAYRSARKTSLRLYDDVRETLLHLRNSGILIVLFTDSLAFYTIDRIKRLELDELVDFIFSPPDHELPPDATAYVHREKYQLKHAKHLHLHHNIVKPNPDVLREILQEIGRSPDECVYVGDSMMKDIAMAQDANVTNVLAKYGKVQDHPGYRLLRSVSHWTDADVERERKGVPRTPTYSVEHFGEITKFFEE